MRTMIESFYRPVVCTAEALNSCRFETRIPSAGLPFF
jgi:hypothetical protein